MQLKSAVTEPRAVATGSYRHFIPKSTIRNPKSASPSTNQRPKAKAPRSVSTRPSPITSRIAKPSKNTLNNKKQKLMLFKSR